MFHGTEYTVWMHIAHFLAKKLTTPKKDYWHKYYKHARIIMSYKPIINEMPCIHEIQCLQLWLSNEL
jgi:hypothetical protein